MGEAEAAVGNSTSLIKKGSNKNGELNPGEAVARIGRGLHEDQAEQIKRISPVSWKHVNFYGKYTFRDIGTVVDLMQVVNTLDAFHAEAPGNRN